MNDQDLFAEIAIDIAAALGVVGESIVSETRYELSIDVEPIPYSPYLIRSVRGEEPRRESGALQESIHATVEGFDTDPTLTVSTDIEYAPRLEYDLNRQFMLPAFERSVEPVLDAVLKAVTR